MDWRSIARPIIEKCVREIGLSDMGTLRKALRDAYPFGERSHHPYKVWLSEIKRQCGGIRKRQYTRRSDLFGSKEQ